MTRPAPSPERLRAREDALVDLLLAGELLDEFGKQREALAVLRGREKGALYFCSKGA